MFKQLLVLLVIMSIVLVGCTQKTAPVAPIVQPTPVVEPTPTPTPTISVDDIVLNENDVSVSIGEVI